MKKNLRDLLCFTVESWTTWSGIQVLSVMLTTKCAPPQPALHRGVKYEIELWKTKVRAGTGLPHRSALRERDRCKQLK